MTVEPLEDARKSGRSRYFVIINQYASTPETGMGGRHFQFARLMARMGHRVDLVMADYHHLLARPRPRGGPVEIETRDGIRIIYLRMMRYGHAHAPLRTANWLLFTWRVAWLDRHLRGKPDAVLISSPSIIVYLPAERLARRHAARLCFEVRDIWPLSLVELGGLSTRHPLVGAMQWIEDRAYRKSDHVVSNLPAAADHMVARGMPRGKFTWIPNGISLETQSPAPPPVPDWSRLVPPCFTIGYAGTVGLANALDTLIDAAALLRANRDIAFVLVGKGRERNRLEQKVGSLGLKSVSFVDPVPRSQVAGLLSHFDACYIGWQPRAIYRFGIAANKLAEYMAAGKPVVHSYSGYGDPVKEAGCGVSSPAGDASALAEAISRLHAMTADERAEMGARGVAHAARHFDNGKNVRRLVAVLEGRAVEPGDLN